MNDDRTPELRIAQEQEEAAKARDGNLPPLGPAWEPPEILPVQFRPAPSQQDRQHG